MKPKPINVVNLETKWRGYIGTVASSSVAKPIILRWMCVLEREHFDHCEKHAMERARGNSKVSVVENFESLRASHGWLSTKHMTLFEVHIPE